MNSGLWRGRPARVRSWEYQCRRLAVITALRAAHAWSPPPCGAGYGERQKREGQSVLKEKQGFRIFLFADRTYPFLLELENQGNSLANVENFVGMQRLDS